MTTAPTEYDASFWKTGVKVMPALVVFHTPPEATPTYHVCLSSGCTAMALTRPDIRAGPTARRRNSLNVPALSGSCVAGAPAGAPAGDAACRGSCAATPTTHVSTTAAIAAPHALRP